MGCMEGHGWDAGVGPGGPAGPTHVGALRLGARRGALGGCHSQAHEAAAEPPPRLRFPLSSAQTYEEALLLVQRLKSHS